MTTYTLTENDVASVQMAMVIILIVGIGLGIAFGGIFFSVLDFTSDAIWWVARKTVQLFRKPSPEQPL